MVIANKADAMVVIDELTRERAALRAENARLREEYADLKRCHDEHYQDVRTLMEENARLRQEHEELGLGVGPHGVDPTHCPTFFDHCHCTVENLLHNIERAKKAEAENERLRKLLNILRGFDWDTHISEAGGSPWHRDYDWDVFMEEVRTELEGDE